MTGEQLREWLDEELNNYPERTSGEELYSFFIKQTEKYVKSNRRELIEALTYWLRLRTEPKTMLALDVAEKHNLTELREEIENLLRDVENGIAFKPYYGQFITKALKKLSGKEGGEKA